MSKVRNQSPQKVGGFFHALSFSLHLKGLVDKKSLPHGGTFGIHNDNPTLPVLFHQFLCGKHRILAGAAQPWGKGQIKQIFVFFKKFCEILPVLLRIYLGCGGHFPLFPHQTIKFLPVQLFILSVRDTVHNVIEVNKPEIIFPDIFCGQIRRCVGDDLIRIHISLLWFLCWQSI